MIDLRKKTIDQMVMEAQAEHVLENPEEYFLEDEEFDYSFEDPDEHE